MQFRSDYLCSVRWEAGLAGGTLDKRVLDVSRGRRGFGGSIEEGRMIQFE